MKLIKAHAYGNDFLIAPIDGLAPEAASLFAQNLCDRHHGIGADGLVFATRTTAGADTQLFNQDGSRAEVSGNGVRCVAAWIAMERGLGDNAEVHVGTAAGMKILTLLDAWSPRFTFRADMGQPRDMAERDLDIDGTRVRASLLNMGNPQCVVFGDVTEERLQALGGPLAIHEAFPDGTNVELAHLDSPTRMRILIWERGVGPTMSSGTGTCAAAVAAMAHHGATRTLEVVAPGGSQSVTWSDGGVLLTGWAELVAEIEWPFRADVRSTGRLSRFSTRRATSTSQELRSS
jgi:diaminopimelate epimerase